MTRFLFPVARVEPFFCCPGSWYRVSDALSMVCGKIEVELTWKSKPAVLTTRQEAAILFQDGSQ